LQNSNNKSKPTTPEENSKPQAMTKTPICHSSQKDLPIQPDPNKMPMAKKKTPILIKRVHKPNIIKSPTITSIIVNATICHHKISGLDTKYSIRGLIPKALGKK